MFDGTLWSAIMIILTGFFFGIGLWTSQKLFGMVVK